MPRALGFLWSFSLRDKSIVAFPFISRVVRELGVHLLASCEVDVK